MTAQARLKELREQHMAAQENLKRGVAEYRLRNRVDIIKSPNKNSPQKRGPLAQPGSHKQRPGSASNVGLTKSPSKQQQHNKTQQTAAIRAYRPDHHQQLPVPGTGLEAATPEQQQFMHHHNTSSEYPPDTVTRHIDNAIAQSVADMLRTPAGIIPPPPPPNTNNKINRTSSLQQSDSSGGSVVSLKPSETALLEGEDAAKLTTPAFMTAKTKPTYCELDDPVHKVPYGLEARSKRQRKQKGGFFSKLFSCFNGGSVMLESPSSRKRPSSAASSNGSAKPTPPMPQLTFGIAPLRQGSSFLNGPTAKEGEASPLRGTGTGYGSKNNDAGDDDGPVDVDLLRRSLARSVAEAVKANPPTPRFGGMPQLSDPGDEALCVHGEAEEENMPMPKKRQSKAALSSQGSAVHPPGSIYGAPSHQQRSSPRRNLMSSLPDAVTAADVQPQRRAVVVQHAAQQYHQQQYVEAPAVQHQHHQQQSFRLPQQQAAPAIAIASRSGSATVSGPPPAKHTEVSLTALLSGGSSSKPAGVKAKPVRGMPSGGPQEDATRSTAVRNQHKKQPQMHNTRTIKSAPPSPVSSAQKMAPMVQKQQQFVSPLKKPSIEPRMTKATLARNQATQRRLDEDKQRELQHYNRLPAAVKIASKGATSAAPSGILASPKKAQVHAPAADQNRPANSNTNALSSGNGSGKSRSQLPVEAGSVQTHFALPQKFTSCPSSPTGSRDVRRVLPQPQAEDNYLQMLERLQMGLSVDATIIKAAKELSPPIIPSQPAVSVQRQQQIHSPGTSSSTSSAVLAANAAATEALTRTASTDSSTLVYSFKKGGAAPSAKPTTSAGISSGNRRQQPCSINPVSKGEVVMHNDEAGQRLVSIHDAALAASAAAFDSNGIAVAVGRDRGSSHAPSVRQSTDSSCESGVSGVLGRTGTLLDQLLTMERSLTLEDLQQLKTTIRQGALKTAGGGRQE